MMLSRQTVPNPLSFRQILCRSPQRAAVGEDVSQGPTTVNVDVSSRPLPIRRLLIPRVIIAAGNYAFLNIVDTALRVVQPVFYSTPIGLGGLGLEPPTIGLILSLCGIVNCILQIIYFPKFHDRFGTKRTYLACIASALPVFSLFPLINQLARLEGLSLAVWSLTIGQALMSILVNFSYGAHSLLAPGPLVAIASSTNAYLPGVL